MTETTYPIVASASVTAPPRRGRRMNALATVAIFGALIVVAAIVIVPILATVLGGFKSLGELQCQSARPAQSMGMGQLLGSAGERPLLAHARQFAADRPVHRRDHAGAVVDGGLRLRPPQVLRRQFLLDYLLLGMLFPSATAILPLFIKVRDLGLLDSYSGVVLPQVAFSLAMAVLLLRNAFRQLPSELLDAAMMDGCGYFRYFFFITLPLSGPILSTVAVISFVGSWNGYLLPLVVLNSESRYPWTLGLMAYQGQYNTSWQLVLAFITLTILPAILMFLFAQRYIVAGLTAGAVKS